MGEVKLTKQGVRDLNSIPAKSKGKKLEMPPKQFFCKHEHKRRAEDSGDTYCPDCNTMWDWDGNEY